MEIYAQNKSDSPIFAAVKFKNLVFASGGGGGQKFGLPNQIETFSLADLQVKECLKTEEIFDRLYANEIHDYLITASETSIVLFEVNHGRLVERDSKKYPPRGKILVHHLENQLLVIVDQSFIIYEINCRHFTLLEVLNLNLDKRVENLCALSNNDVLIAFESDLLIFSVPNSKFVEEALKLKKCQKLHLERKSAHSFLAVYSNQDHSVLCLHSRETSRTFVEKSSLKITTSLVLGLATLENVVALSNREGEVLLLSGNPSGESFVFVKRMKLHDLPITSMILRYIPTT